MIQEQRLAKRFALLIGILLAAISCNEFDWTRTGTKATWAAVDGLRVQLRPRALHAGNFIKCISQHLNGTYAQGLAQDEDLNQVDGSNWASCKLDLMTNFMSPFIGIVRIGQPEQEFEMLLDTGSDVLWVTHSECKANGAPLGKSRLVNRNYVNLFEPQRSQTFRLVERVQELSITYINGFTFRGPLGRDVLQFGKRRGKSSSSSPAMFVPDQEFAVISSIDHEGDEKYDCVFDGIIGLRPPRNDTEANLIASLTRHKLVQEPVFAVDIRQRGPKLVEPQPGLVAGELVFGGIDHTRYVGPIVWAPVNFYPKWRIRVDRIEVVEQLSGRKLVEVCEFGCNAIVDTGTNYVLGPKLQAESLNRALGFETVGKSKRIWWSPDCLRSELARKTTLVYHIAGHKFVFNDYAVIFDDQQNQERICVSMISPGQALNRGEGADYWILGAPFIEKFYTVFDYGQQRVGFALKAD